MFRHQMCYSKDMDSFHQLSRCSRISSKPKSCLGQSLFFRKESRDRTCFYRTRGQNEPRENDLRNHDLRSVMRIPVIQKWGSKHTWSLSIGRNSNSSHVCAVTNWEPQHRCRKEHSLVSLSLGCGIYKRHLFFSLVSASETTFSSSKHQNSSKKTPCDKERAPKTVTFDGMTVPPCFRDEENQEIYYKRRHVKQTVQRLYISSLLSASLHMRLEMYK
jgi:hypothetical protein